MLKCLQRSQILFSSLRHAPETVHYPFITAILSRHSESVRRSFQHNAAGSNQCIDCQNLLSEKRSVNKSPSRRSFASFDQVFEVENGGAKVGGNNGDRSGNRLLGLEHQLKQLEEVPDIPRRHGQDVWEVCKPLYKDCYQLLPHLKFL